MRLSAQSTSRRDYYAQHLSTKHAAKRAGPIVPDDVKRIDSHEPCFMCGAAREPCRHREFV